MWKIVIEIIVTFIILFSIYFFMILKKCNKKNEYVSQEVNIILSIYRIDYHKINLQQMTYIVAIITSLVLAISITFAYYWLDHKIISFLLAVLLSLVCLAVVYGIIGRIYQIKALKNSGKVQQELPKNNNKVKQKEKNKRKSKKITKK